MSPPPVHAATTVDIVVIVFAYSGAVVVAPPPSSLPTGKQCRRRTSWSPRCSATRPPPDDAAARRWRQCPAPRPPWPPGNIHRPHFPLPLQVDCCIFTPLVVGGGDWGHHQPLLFSGLTQLPLVVTVKMSRWGCGVAATATAIPALASGQVCPSPAGGMCTSEEASGSGGRAGMMLFVAISVAFAMVVILIRRVAILICCRVYVQYGTECVGI